MHSISHLCHSCLSPLEDENSKCLWISLYSCLWWFSSVLDWETADKVWITMARPLPGRQHVSSLWQWEESILHAHHITAAIYKCSMASGILISLTTYGLMFLIISEYNTVKKCFPGKSYPFLFSSAFIFSGLRVHSIEVVEDMKHNCPYCLRWCMCSVVSYLVLIGKAM